MRQFEIWWAELPEPVGRRPVMLLTRTPALRYLSRCTVVEISSVVRGLPVEVPLGADEGLRRRCVANFDNVAAIPVRTLAARIGSLSERRISEAKRALGHALDWPELMDA